MLILKSRTATTVICTWPILRPGRLKRIRWKKDGKIRWHCFTQPPCRLTEYTGKYVNDIYGHLEVTTGEGNNLEMRFEHHPRMYAKLEPLGGNRFFVTFSDPTLGKAVFPFYVQNGKVTGVKVKVADFVEYGPYEFRKE